MKVRLSLLRCGKCGQPRGLRHHLCRGGRKGRDRLRVKARFECGKCHRRVTNPFTHTCTIRSDWAKRKRQAEQRKKRDAAQEKRKQRAADAAAKRKTAARERKAAAVKRRRKPRAAPHNPRTCREEGCQRYPCRLYEEGYADGVASMSGSEAD